MTPQTPVMEELYNLLMQQIEPELTTDMIPQLAEMYADETPAEWKKRDARYKRAYALYEERFTALMDMWKADIEKARDALVTSSKS